MVRIEILGTSERRILEAYLKGECPKDYTELRRIRITGLRRIIKGCEYDLSLLRRLEDLVSSKKKPFIGL